MSKKIHIIDNKTGYCSTCQKYEGFQTNKDSYLDIGKVISSVMSQNSDKSMKKLKKPVENPFNSVKYKRYTCLDLCKGKCSEKWKGCYLCETLYYLPLWVTLIVILLIAGLIAALVYVSLTYANQTVLQTYTEPCNSTIICDQDKGLNCRTANASGTNAFCNCPALSIINTCDCVTSRYWDGLQCSPVMNYGEGDCPGDYACVRGLSCDALTGKCKCPDSKPVWDSKGKQCNYMYMGCYFFNSTATKYDITMNQIYLIGSGANQVELDDCLYICAALSLRYTHMLSNSGGSPRCGCSNTYNTYATQFDDINCNMPCSVFNYAGQNLCPKTGFYSSFQIGL